MANYTFDNTIPAATNNPSDDQPDMLANNISNALIWTSDHRGFNEDGSGLHKQVTFYSNNTPATTSSPTAFTSTVGSLPQLFFYSTNRANSNQYSTSASGSTMLLGGMILKWATSVTNGGSGGNVNVSFSSAFPNACLSVVISPANAAASVSIAYVTSISASGFSIRPGGVPFPANSNFSYMAVGY